MNTVPVFDSRHQSLERVRGHLRAVVAPQELRGATLGAQPLQRRDHGVGVDVRSTSITSDSRVNSSTMLSSFSARPSAVWSNWKSNAHTWLGRSARSRSAGTVDSPSRRRLRLRAGPAAPPRATGAAPACG